MEPASACCTVGGRSSAVHELGGACLQAHGLAGSSAPDMMSSTCCCRLLHIRAAEQKLAHQAGRTCPGVDCGLACLDISPDGSALLAVGKTARKQPLLVLWDVSNVHAGASRLLTAGCADPRLVLHPLCQADICKPAAASKMHLMLPAACTQSVSAHQNAHRGLVLCSMAEAAHEPAVFDQRAAGGLAQVITRHASEVDIRAARWLPCGPTTPQSSMQLVTCGRDSLRTLRLKVGPVVGLSARLPGSLASCCAKQ